MDNLNIPILQGPNGAYAVCPDCGIEVNLGLVGLSNLTKRHRGNKVCLRAKSARDKHAMKSKTLLHNFFMARPPKKAAIPLTMAPYIQPANTVTTPEPSVITPKDVNIEKSSSPHAGLLISPTTPTPVVRGFFEELYHLIAGLPNTIPEATEYDDLAAFGGNPQLFDDPSLDAEDLWEMVINQQLKAVLGWGAEADMDHIIRRGKKGLDALFNFVKHFIVKRGMSEGLFEGKLTHLMTALPVLLDVNHINNEVIDCAPDPMATEIPKLCEEPRIRTVIDVNVFVYEDTVRGTHESIPASPKCSGYVLAFPRQKSPFSSYPFALHDTLVLPWELPTKGGVMSIVATTCTGISINGLSCNPWLNQAKKLLGKAEVQRVDRVLAIGLRQKKSACSLMAVLSAAAQGFYKPQSYTEEEAMNAILSWRLFGNRCAAINRNSKGAPSVSYLRSRLTVRPIVPSPRKPTAKEVETNVKSVMHKPMAPGKNIHAVLMFNELATEKRIRWDPLTNCFLGVCRQHAHHASTEFINEDDMVELFQAIDDDEIHHAGEATVAALGILTRDHQIYPGRPILVSGNCKRETGEEHAGLIKTVLAGIDAVQQETRVHIVSLASDGETRQGSAFIILTFKQKLANTSPLYPLLSTLPLLNLHHFKSFGLTAEHVRATFNPEDKQDVKLAFNMLKDIWSLPRTSEDDTSPGKMAAQEALWILGKFLFHLVFPYLCVDLSLSEQIEHLNAAVHMAMALYHQDGKDFLPTGLYIDLMITIKNIIFCLAKAKTDDPEGKFFIILLGTDRLEELFGILHTMIGNNANLDILQLIGRLAGTTEIANIFAKYLHWDRAPHRLKLPVLSHNSKELHDRTDHIKPPLWRGDVRVKNDCPFLVPILKTLDSIPNADMLSPHGVLLFNVPLADDDIDKSLECPDSEPSGNEQRAAPAELDQTVAELSETDAALEMNATLEPLVLSPAPPPLESPEEIRVDVEDALAKVELEDDDVNLTHTCHKIEKNILIGGVMMSKSQALSRFSKYRKLAGSTDCLWRVQSKYQYYPTSPTGTDAPVDLAPAADEGQMLLMSNPVVYVLSSKGKLWLSIGEVKALMIDGQSVDSVSYDMLQEIDEADDLKHDWRTYQMAEKTLSVPGVLVAPVNPTLSSSHSNIPWYLLESSVLIDLAASMTGELTTSQLKCIPKYGPNKEFPYRELTGMLTCFNI
ncbi:hypothetical protein HYPSUDRAFT_70894 [Hypholoma sublateritium FD-334 SS-4]|uniref:Uncharacterized protein n=1 Tax=Hypholoma sublateritium (strain FD-334 SS-4) TaxID=945553 RepID=A0A0D2M1Y6_HYPSF|nr:hypothetical protein HYPSUDRAFT_70894 [Hypholoma sublateritium FD-334 SS-4]